ncbi:hypothetical protein B5S32_g5394 [[Candida] boidinii]|nr:hypothetical protein B5S32_g5394 [[Candida] boidinii]GMF77308.1 unnamed protein product [[Candida] boidinii]GMF82343.1 unnamed protein product [[Candida] boidinii]
MYSSITQKDIDSMTSGLVQIELFDYIKEIDSNIKRDNNKDSFDSDSSHSNNISINNSDNNSDDNNDNKVNSDNDLNKDEKNVTSIREFIWKLSNLLSGGLIDKLKVIY